MDERAEVWMASPSVNGLEVSNLGRVRIVPYRVVMPKGGTKLVGGAPSAGTFYAARRRVQFVWRGRTHIVSRLVCEAFNGAPFTGAYCLHINEDPQDNRPENPRWGTQKENLNYPGFLHYCRSRTGEKSPYKKGVRARRVRQEELSS